MTENLPWDTTETTEVNTPTKSTPAQRGTPVTSGGKRVNVNSSPPSNLIFKNIPEEYEPTPEVDYQDISELNRDINNARRALFYATKELSKAEQVEANAKYAYKNNVNREMVKLSGGSEKQRIAIAELATEELYGHFLVAERARVAAENYVRAIRADLSALEGLGHNIRAQMQVM